MSGEAAIHFTAFHWLFARGLLLLHFTRNSNAIWCSLLHCTCTSSALHCVWQLRGRSVWSVAVRQRILTDDEKWDAIGNPSMDRSRDWIDCEQSPSSSWSVMIDHLKNTYQNFTCNSEAKMASARFWPENLVDIAQVALHLTCVSWSERWYSLIWEDLTVIKVKEAKDELALILLQSGSCDLLRMRTAQGARVAKPQEQTSRWTDSSFFGTGGRGGEYRRQRDQHFNKRGVEKVKDSVLNSDTHLPSSS